MAGGTGQPWAARQHPAGLLARPLFRHGRADVECSGGQHCGAALLLHALTKHSPTLGDHGDLILDLPHLLLELDNQVLLLPVILFLIAMYDLNEFDEPLNLAMHEIIKLVAEPVDLLAVLRPLLLELPPQLVDLGGAGPVVVQGHLAEVREVLSDVVQGTVHVVEDRGVPRAHGGQRIRQGPVGSRHGSGRPAQAGGPEA
mmetsp:Transcript_53184/g.128012  ORF Transcript_53184/g.128012 Transcript_53184/m.128012 type:complete len:200 (+) Transcript_53184:153-752(+)